MYMYFVPITYIQLLDVACGALKQAFEAALERAYAVHSVSGRHAQASAWAGLVGFAQEEGTRLVRGPADTPTSTSVWFCFQSRDSNI